MPSCSLNVKRNAKVCSNIIVAYLAIIIDMNFGLHLLFISILIYLKIFLSLIKFVVNMILSLKVFSKVVIVV